MNKLKVYRASVPFWSAEPPKIIAWEIGPLHAWKVGDEVVIPERSPRFGADRPGCPLARVTRVNEDGVAIAVDVRELDKKVESRYAA